MGGFLYSKFISDLIRRTDTNLGVINELHETKNSEYEVYEITQLVNSLFSSIVFPYEKYKSLLTQQEKVFLSQCSNNLDIDDESNEIFMILKKNYDNKKYFNNYENQKTIPSKYDESQFSFLVNTISHFRNALSHSGNKRLLFVSSYNPELQGEEITSIIFMDHYDKDDIKSDFCIELTIKDVKIIRNSITGIFQKIELAYEQTSFHRDEFIDYSNKIKAARTLMEKRKVK